MITFEQLRETYEAIRHERAMAGRPLFDDDEREDELLLIPKRSAPRDKYFTHRAGKIENPNT